MLNYEKLVDQSRKEQQLGAAAGGVGQLISSINSANQGVPGTVVATDEDSLTTTEQTQTTEQTSTLDQLLQQLTTLQENITQQQTQQQADQQTSDTTGQQVVQNLTPEERANLNATIQGVQAQLGGQSPFSQDAAAAASQQATQQAVDQVLRSNLGTVAQQGTNFGAFGGTPQAESAVNVAERATQAGAQVALQNQQAFGQLANQEQGQLLQQLASLQQILTGAGSTTDTTGTTTTEGTSTTDTTATTDRREVSYIA